MLPPGLKPGTKNRPHVEKGMVLKANIDSQCICANRFGEDVLLCAQIISEPNCLYAFTFTLFGKHPYQERLTYAS